MFAFVRIRLTGPNIRTYSILAIVFPLVLSYCCFGVGSVMASILEPSGKTRRGVFVAFVGMLPLTAYVLWARSRIANWHFALDDQFPRAFPYPDKLLITYHDYLDAIHPVEDDRIKLHGEFPLLHLQLDALSLVCIAVGALLIGAALCARRTESRFHGRGDR